MNDSASFVCVVDIHAADVGMAYELGVLYRAGSVLVDVLPAPKAALVKVGKILPVADYEALQRRKPPNKRGVGPSENK